MKAKKKSDAVAKSRKWKEAAAKETEGITIEQVIASLTVRPSAAASRQLCDGLKAQVSQEGR
jgi:hypothetical protein